MDNLKQLLSSLGNKISQWFFNVKATITSAFSQFATKIKDYFYNSLLYWEELALKMDNWYDQFSNKLNKKAENVGHVAKPVFNATYFFGEAAYAFYSTLQLSISLAPVVLPLIAISNIPFFEELSAPLVTFGIGVISCLAAYFKYTSLQYQNSQDEQISINKAQLEKLKGKLKKQNTLIKKLQNYLDQNPNHQHVNKVAVDPEHSRPKPRIPARRHKVKDPTSHVEDKQPSTHRRRSNTI